MGSKMKHQVNRTQNRNNLETNIIIHVQGRQKKGNKALQSKDTIRKFIINDNAHCDWLVLVFYVVAPCRVVHTYSVSEEHTASIFRAGIYQQVHNS
jgi:hypothetical protein